MPDSLAKRRTRLAIVLEKHLRHAVYGATVPLSAFAHHLPGEPVPYAEAVAGTYAPCALGDAWGPRWGTTWFRLEGQVPAEWAGHEVVARVNFGFTGAATFAGGEALIYDGGVARQGIAATRSDYRISRSARGGEPVLLHVEAAANPPLPAATFEGGDWPLHDADPGGPPLYQLTLAELAVVDREAYALLHDFRVLNELLATLPETEPRWHEVFTALERCVALLDLDDIAGTAAAARVPLLTSLARPALPSAHVVSAVGHAHLDTAWLWPARETRRKAARTFTNALRLMDDYPEFRFVASQPQQYEWIRQDHPALFEEIGERVKSGQLEPVGGMWVEADCNVPSGESLARQIIHGKRFFLEHFDYEPRDVWIPDVFGYPACLPQLIRESGSEFFLTQKMSWNDTNVIPHHTFWWEGLDGSRVFTHFPPADTYIGNMSVPEVTAGAQRFAHHAVSNRSLYPFGFGDGGGGATAEMLESARRLADLEGAPKVVLEPAIDFFRKAIAESGPLPVWVGELYAEFHRGTYTTQSALKRANRKNEFLLGATELWSAFAPVDYPHAELDRLWKLVLLHQFHDIIPGSSINWVYRDALADHAEVTSVATELRDRALEAIAADVDTSAYAEPVVVFNQAGQHRTEVVEIAGRRRVVTVPSCGYATVDAAADLDQGVPPVSTGRNHLDNGIVRIEWDDAGLLTSVRDLRTGREILADGQRGNVFQLFVDRPNSFDAWDIDETFRDSMVELTDVDSIEPGETDALRGSVRIVRSFRSSRIEQTISLEAGSPLVRFDTMVDWHEKHRLLKVAFPVDVRSMRATYGIQHGLVERTTHNNTSWDAAQFEVCAHRWADLSEPGLGVALLNDCKYGYDIKGALMRLTLLRSPTAPDPLADQGRHEFSYALLPHGGDLRSAGVIEQALAFNMPLVAVPATPHAGARPETHSFVELDAPGVQIEAVKRADADDGVVVRLHEAFGGRQTARLRVDGASAAQRTDLLERAVGALPMNGDTTDVPLTPFALRTVKVTS